MQHFIDILKDDPGDATARAMLGDWCEENGYAEEAEFVRLDHLSWTELLDIGMWDRWKELNTKFTEGAGELSKLSALITRWSIRNTPLAKANMI